MSKWMIEQELSKDMWFDKFVIDAKNEKDALDKAHGWARYHSFSYSENSGIRVRLATEEEAEHRTHNE